MNNSKTKIFLADTLPLQNPQRLNDYLNQITVVRREKILRLKSIQAQALSMGAEMLLQKALFKSFGINKELTIEIGSQGKPSFIDNPEIHFNLSHSGHYVVCALARDEVGVDLQKMKQLNLKLAKRYFAEEEVTWLFELPVEKQKKGFFDLWSIKESYMKYTGKGFALPMKSFSVRIGAEFPGNGGVTVYEGNEKITVAFKKYGGLEDYALWCCSSSSNFEEELEWMRMEKEV
ncbi:MAG: 4'-phosphopantetheinyl transferase superfamily protein [Eubacteriaceae bacterium]|nr:4'-phosphopantetheinyl transferase superfamily protein [Eubacteriaceae bacterium]